MRKHQVLVAVAAFFAAIPLVSHAASIVGSTDQRIGIDPANTPMPVMSGGKFIIVNGAGTAHPILILIDEAGFLQTFPVEVPGAQRVWLWSYAHGVDGTVAAGGEAIDADKRPTRFIALFPPNGKPAQLIRTGQYGALMVAVTNDGSVWTAGIEALNEKPPGATSASAAIAPYLNSSVVRRFNNEGRLTGSFVPQSSLKDFGNILPTGTFLAANADTVVLYSPKEQRYLEFSAQGITLDLNGIQAPAQPGMFTGFTVTTSGRVYVSGIDVAGHNNNFLMNLDKANRTWVPVAMNDSSFRGLYGAKNENLAAQTTDPLVIRFLTVSDVHGETP